MLGAEHKRGYFRSYLMEVRTYMPRSIGHSSSHLSDNRFVLNVFARHGNRVALFQSGCFIQVRSRLKNELSNFKQAAICWLDLKEVSNV
jgi:hypothetical protein